LKGFATQVAVSPDGRHLYVTKYAFDGHNSGTLAVINTVFNRVGTTSPVGELPTAVAVSPDGGHAYVINDGSGTFSVIDTVTNTVTTTIPVGTSPGSVAISPDGSYAYVTMIDGTVSVISL
jgi:YVTN family beta-propeller protein